jgi:hypothetical protein
MDTTTIIIFFLVILFFLFQIGVAKICKKRIEKALGMLGICIACALLILLIPPIRPWFANDEPSKLVIAFAQILVIGSSSKFVFGLYLEELVKHEKTYLFFMATAVYGGIALKLLAPKASTASLSLLYDSIAYMLCGVGVAAIAFALELVSKDVPKATNDL